LENSSFSRIYGQNLHPSEEGELLEKGYGITSFAKELRRAQMS
jgi:hypothetical protein